MGKKKCNDCEKKNNNQQKKNDKDDGGKKDINTVTVVLKMESHCEGCASKVIKSIRCFEGVESVKEEGSDIKKITVVGKVDPMKLREQVEQKTKKKVELVSPLPKKENNGKEKGDKKDKNGDGEEKKKTTGDKPAKQSDEKKSKEPPVTTAVLKVHLHCEGCIQKIHRVVSKTKGFLDMSIDRQKDLVTVKGAIDVKALAESLKEKLKKSVEIVPPKKEGGGEKKEKSEGGEKVKGGGGDKAAAAGGGGGGDGGGDGGFQVEGNINRMEFGPFEYPNPYVYGPGYMMHPVHAPQLFSDENPNACSVM